MVGSYNALGNLIHDRLKRFFLYMWVFLMDSIYIIPVFDREHDTLNRDACTPDDRSSAHDMFVNDNMLIHKIITI